MIENDLSEKTMFVIVAVFFVGIAIVMVCVGADRRMIYDWLFTGTSFILIGIAIGLGRGEKQ